MDSITKYINKVIELLPAVNLAAKVLHMDTLFPGCVLPVFWPAEPTRLSLRTHTYKKQFAALVSHTYINLCIRDPGINIVDLQYSLQ